MDSHRRPELRPSSSLGSMRADKKVGEDGGDDDPKDEDGELGFEGDKKKKKLMAIGGSGRRGSAAGGGCVGGASPPQPQCQADNCTADLSCAKRYHRRHKVCELHAKSPVVLVTGLQQRFCQQCSRFHEISEFDEAKKSCRKRLAGHNERRRKSSSESQGEGSSNGEMDLQLKENHCRHSDEKGRTQITLPINPSLKHFHIR